MPISPEVYGHALIARGWLSPDASRNPVRWNYIPPLRSWERRLFARIRSLAIKCWDAWGVDLVEQVIKFIENTRHGTLEECIQAVFQARQCLFRLGQAGYPHFHLIVADLDEALDEYARLARCEITRRLLTNEIAGDEAIEAIRKLQVVIDAGWWPTVEADIDEVEANLVEVRGFGT